VGERHLGQRHLGPPAVGGHLVDGVADHLEAGVGARILLTMCLSSQLD
jgi:hypothetical protein